MQIKQTLTRWGVPLVALALGLTAFRIIAERVERSLFALRALDRTDWEAARAAYADFALARLNVRGQLA